MNCEPNIQRWMWGRFGTATRCLGATFVGRVAIETADTRRSRAYR